MSMNTSEIMPLEELLHQIRSRPLLLTGKATLWSPNTYVPMRTRRAIKQYHSHLRVLLSCSDVRTCASPGLHRAHYRYAGDGLFMCDICARITV